MAIEKKPITEGQKWLISFMSAVVFFVIASPFMFKLTGVFSSLAGVKTEDNGIPNVWGLLLHAIVFAGAIRIAMFVPLPDVN